MTTLVLLQLHCELAEKYFFFFCFGGLIFNQISIPYLTHYGATQALLMVGTSSRRAGLFFPLPNYGFNTPIYNMETTV